MINQVPVNVISADEIFMTQMKVVYFLMQTTLAGCLLCFIFKMTVLGVVSLQLFLLFFYQGNTLRVEFCRRHSIMRTRGEMILWKASLLVIILLTAFIIFNLMFTLVIVVFGNFENSSLYWDSIINTFNKKKVEITLAIQIFSLFIQSVVIFLFFFKKQMELIIYKPESILEQYIIKDLSIIPDDRVECIICLDEMRQCSKNDTSKQIQIKKEGSNDEQINMINQNAEFQMSNIQTSCESPMMNSIQSSSKNFNYENMYQLNAMKIDSIKDEEQYQYNEDNDCKLEEENIQIPNQNILALQRISISNGTKNIDGFKSLIMFKDNQQFEQFNEQGVQSCQCIDSKIDQLKQIAKQRRKSSHKSTRTEGGKSTNCDSQTNSLQSQQECDQLNNITSSIKGEEGKISESEIQKNQEGIDSRTQNSIEQPQNQENKEETESQVNSIKNNKYPIIITLQQQQSSNGDLQVRSDSNNNQQEENSNNNQNQVVLQIQQNSNQQNEQAEQHQKKVIVGFKCKHFFHYECMKQWLKTSQNLRCPTCRQNSML